MGLRSGYLQTKIWYRCSSPYVCVAVTEQRCSNDLRVLAFDWGIYKIILTDMLLVTLLHLFDFTFKIISIFMYRTCFSYTFSGYNDHISINNLCFQINNFWMVLLDMKAITRILCQSLVLSIFLDVTDLFVNKRCVACNKFYNALRGILYSLNNYMATNSSPSLHIPNGTKLSVSCFWEQKFRNRAMLYGEKLIELLNMAIGF